MYDSILTLNPLRVAVNLRNFRSMSLNIRDWSDTSPGLVEASALFVPGPLGTGDSLDDGTTHHLKRACKTSSDTGRAWRGENNPRTSENEAQGKNLEKGASGE